MRPPPNLTVSEWADEYGMLSAESSAEPGRWHTYSYQRAIMDAFIHPRVERVVVMKSARIGWTKILGHVWGYHVHLDPCSMLVVQPTIEDAEGWSKEELTPMIEDTPVLLDRVGDQKSRSTGNTITKKRYPGGISHTIGANSPRGFRRITVRLALMDEVDGYPPTAGTEGDQLKLAEKRTETYWNRKVGIGSTPTEKGFSRIERWFARSSKGHYILKCPHCDSEHIRRFRQPDEPVIVAGEELPVSHLHWQDDNPSTAAWVCPVNGCTIEPSQHRRMMEHGYWKGDHWTWRRDEGFTFDDDFDGTIGFSIWAGYSYSPNSTPAKLVREFLSVKEDVEELKTFVNTVLGETWEEKGEKVSDHMLAQRREEFPAPVPADAWVLTAGVDIQGDRVELEVVGWNPSLENWSVDYQILPGDTSQSEVWDDLLHVLKGRYSHQSGAELSIRGVCVDSGYLPKKVGDFVKRAGLHVFGTKGFDGAGRPVVESIERRAERLRKQRRKDLFRPEIIGTDEGKTIIYRQLRVGKPGQPGYCHFPHERDDEYFAQLTAEKLMLRYKKGRPIRSWMPTRPRNEALDCRVLAYAALLLSGGVSGLKAPTPTDAKRTSKRRRSPPPVGQGFERDGWAL